MRRSTLKENVLPFILMLIGCLIILALSLYLFQTDYPLLGALLMGLLAIAIGVVGIVLTSPKPPQGAPSEGDAAPQVISSSSVTGPSEGFPAGVIAPDVAPPVTPFATVYVSPTKQYTLTFSKPVLIAGTVVFICIALLLLFGLGAATRSLLITRDTRIVDCREAATAITQGWHVVLTYTYNAEEAASGATLYSACVLERERYVWEKEKRTAKEKAPTETVEPGARGLPTWTPSPWPVASYTPSPASTAGIPGASFPTETPFSPPVAGATQTPWPTATPFSPPTTGVTQTPWPTATPFSPPTAGVTQTPWPTATPFSPPTAGVTQTPQPSPPSSSPGSEVDVCTTISNDAYLNASVKWSGLIVEDPSDEDEGVLFKVLWTNPNTGSGCSEAIFFVLYVGDERFFQEDQIIVRGTITNTRYEYETEAGESAFTVLVRTDAVELLDEP
ncbi:MAG TPA: hypothetical protein PLJ78_00550 [Anaerolineae bacterium]|nr:hypothetical protein [Anaerolineae bacterium]HQK12416.1 hypothetical protein [Anaerolineae bacterium]